MQKVKITVEVDGEVVEQVVEEVDGTLAQMEDKIDAMTRHLAARTLQASVDRVAAPRHPPGRFSSWCERSTEAVPDEPRRHA